MKLSGNTILITGGSSGIGLELSKRLINNQNKVIICGRSQQKLERAKAQLPQLETIQCDLSQKEQCKALAQEVMEKYPKINVLINNAALVHKVDFLTTNHIMEMAEQEVETNFLAPLRLIHFLYPQLQQNADAHIINVTTGLIYTPRADYPFYNATKAALHSFTQVFRSKTETGKVRTVEVMFPAVNTPWHKGNPPKIAISTEKAVDGMLAGLQKGRPEVRIARVKLLYKISRIAPKFAFNKINSLADV
ncbi:MULTISPECIES: SDR family oxidoreductase [Flavobacteriaceae]|uniref:SDR family oxidoreductase n=1 Tax=Flavobacteriaceae TaxID=49546 RepID=UPI00234B482C|nr:SDR family NAD(P)-dependent oxidoreductase [Muricauda sp. SP22]MDC6361508.1 SDR family NAD(P)-dependent oxidoreductase [Muricauda sp. SP22]